MDMLLLASWLVAAAPSSPAAHVSPWVVRPELRLHLVQQVAISPHQVHMAAREAERIWASHLTLVFEPRASPIGEAGPSVLTVVLSNRPVRTATPAESSWETALASIGFYAPDTPQALVQVYMPGVVRLAKSAKVGGVRVSEWPVRLAEEAVARVLGRVLAHEIGHFVLRSSRHSEAGLMRSTHPATEFAAFPWSGFRLAPADIVRVQTIFKESTTVAAAP